MSKSKYIVRTYKVPVPVGLYGQCSKLNKIAAQIYNETISIIKKTKEDENRWLSIGEVQKYIKDWSKDINIHSHSRQAIVELYFRALDSYFKAVKKDPNRKPPYKEKKTMSFIWKYTAVKLFPNGKLQLSMGRNHEPFEIQTTLPGGTKIREVRLVKESSKYYLHLVIEVQIGWENTKEHSTTHNNVMSVDLGILKPITCFDGKEVISYHGGTLNSLLQYRNKKIAIYQQKLSRCKKGSRRYKKLQKAKKKMLVKTKNKIKDILHKITSNFIGLCVKKGIDTIVIGDIRHIRDRVEGNDNTNQKVHQWLFGEMIDMITYKAEMFGIEVKFVSEAYTSQTCPVCGHRNHVSDRNYKCKHCGFEYHRDGVGAINIYKRYLGIEDLSQVVVGLAPTRGVRFNPHLCGHGVKTTPWKVAMQSY